MVYTFNVDNNGAATFDGDDDGSMTLIGSGELTQARVNTAITSYSDSGKSVSLPSTVLIAGTFTSLGSYAFLRTAGLTSIKFSEDSLVTMFNGFATFSECTSLTSLSLPPKLTTVTQYMCYGCKNLLIILIPSPVTKIGKMAFQECLKLHTVLFGPNSKLTIVNDGAFYGTIGLVRIEFPESFTTWSEPHMFGGQGASIRAMRMNRNIFNSFSFRNSTLLPAVPTGSRRLITFYGEDPIIYDNPSGQILNIVVDQYAYEQVMDITPSPYTGSMSLYGKGELTAAQVTAAKDQHGIRYSGQTLLEVLIGPEFTGVDFPENFTNVGTNTFGSGTAVRGLRMSNITLWNKIKSTVPSGAITTFNSEPGVFQTWNGSTLTNNTGGGLVHENNVLTGTYTGKLKIIGELSRSVIDTVVTSSGSFLPLEIVLEGGTLTVLEDGIFTGLSGLTSVQFPADSVVKTIGARSFQNCTVLTGIDFPESVTSIGKDTFFGATSVKTLRMNRSLWTQGNIYDVLPDATSRRIVTFYGEDPLMYNNPSGSTLTTVVDQYAYEQVMKITPSPYTGSMSLYGKGQLNQSQVNAAIDQHGTQYAGQSLQEVTIGSGFTSLGNTVFSGTGFTSIKFSEDSLVTTIGNRTFYDCGSMTSLILPPKLTSISESMCDKCAKLETILIPATVTSMDSFSIAFCSALHTVSFGPNSKLTSILEGVFYNSTSIARIEFPPSFTSWTSPNYGMFGVTTPGKSIRAMRLNRSIFNSFTFVNNTVLVAVPTEFRRLITFYGEDPIIYDNPSGASLTVVVDQYAYEQVMDITPSPYTGSMSLYGKGELTQAQVTAATSQHGQQFPDDGQPLQEITIGSDFTDVTLPRGLVTSGLYNLDGATAIQSLRVERQLWESSFKSSLPENISGFKQLVQFYGDHDILETLTSEKAALLQTDDYGGYQKVSDYYLDRDIFIVDRTAGVELVKIGETGVTYDVGTTSLLSAGGLIYEGILNIVGTGGELTQSILDAAIGTHTTALNGVNRPLHTLVVGDKFTSLSSTLSLKGTGLTSLQFPAESPITTTGFFELVIDSTLDTFVVLPKWVTQQGPWSL
jgi:hypothetical protein